MKNKTLNKDIKKSITNSFGRFISIMLLMALGSFALIGLSVSGPDMRKTGANYFNKYNTADITIMSDYGITTSEINSIKKVSNLREIEYIYLKDVTLKNSTKSYRIFSNTENISTYELFKGKIPTKENEIALDTSNESKYKIGDTISFIEKENEYGEKVLKRTTFKITGFIKSTEILSTLNRGQTTTGTGSLDCYAVVDKKAFSSSVYMMAKLNFKDTKNIDPYTSTYNKKIINHKKELENILEDNKSIRFDLIKSEYKEKLDFANNKLVDAKKELENAKNLLEKAKNKIDKAKQEININENKLKNANQELKDAENELEKNKINLNNNKSKLQASKKQLNTAQNNIESSDERLKLAKKQLDETEKLISEKEQILNTKKQELDTAEQLLNENKNKLKESKKELDKNKNSYETAINELNSNINELENKLKDNNLTDTEKEEYEKQVNDLKNNLETTKNEYNSYIENIYNPNTTEIEKNLKSIEEQEKEIQNNKILINENLKEIEKSKQELNLKKEDYNNSKNELDLAKKEYNQKVLEYNNALEKIKEADAKILVAESTINSKKSEYQEGVKTLNNTKQELESKESEYYEKLEEYNEKRIDAEKEISDGEEKLNEEQEKYNNLESPVYEVDNRRETPGGEGYKIYETVSNIIDSLSDIFPWFMYFVAALVTLTTMTRFVDEERINMGTLTSLGYSDKDIIKKFVVYGFISASIGTILGVTLGHILIPYIVYNAYGHGFTFPKIELHFYLKETILACILSLLCSVLPAYIVAKNNLKEKPADLLLPKAPVSGSKILLERIKPIWNRLNFTHKVTARNIFRYKKRMLMTIFGVAGASAILFTGFSVQKSVSTINDKQFKEIIKYDMIVALNDTKNNKDLNDFNKLIEKNNIKSYSKVYYDEATKKTGKNNDKQEIKVIVPEDNNLNGYIDLRNRKTKNNISLSKDGVVISERFAKALNVKIGDKFTIEDSKGNKHTLKVTNICEMYAGHFIFMNKEYYEKTYNTKYTTNAYMFKLKDSTIENTKQVSAKFMNLNITKGVVQNTTMYNMVNTIVNSLNKIMIVLIVLAVLLTVVILFNLTNINVEERIRELSTIKVLGFRDNEVTMYIYRETIILSEIGIIIGWLFGIILHNYILTVVPPDEVMFDPSVWIGAYIISFVVINIVTFILKYYINKKLIDVDMIEALKSVD